ncbi:MAG: carbonic anhydrase [Alphaproteobacteria bacterium]|nr:carbonic anhydrase [Alphaproteobacteria bacterium]
MPRSLPQLIEGHRDFHRTYSDDTHASLRQQLVARQQPQVMVIGCCDSRVDPALLLQADLGDLFVYRSVANFVPAYCSDQPTAEGTGAALEFAVCHLRVAHIIVLGHSQCGGINALMTHDMTAPPPSMALISPWIDQLAAVKRRVIAKTVSHHASDTPAETLLEKQCAVCEREGVLHSLAHLPTYPFVRTAMEKGELHLHGWHVDIATGDITVGDSASADFAPLLVPSTSAGREA